MPERLTDRAIGAIKPAAASIYIFDSEVSGLAVRVYPSGIKSFVFDWRHLGRQRRITIGRFPAWTTAKARIHASKLRLKADTGEVVSPGRGERVNALIETWRSVVAVTRRPGTVKAYDILITSHILPSFGRDDPKAITRNRVEHWHGSIAQMTPVAANRALAVLSAFLSWLERDHMIERNPCKGVKRRPESPRQVFLNASEIGAALAELDADFNRRAALALKLALLTGARIGEVLSLSPEQIDISRRVWTKPGRLTKQQRASIVPLQDQALAVAQALLQYQGPLDHYSCHHCWQRVRARIGRRDVRIHDLRHSRASSLARNGASLMQIGRVLGHASPATTSRYAHLLDDDLRDLVARS